MSYYPEPDSYGRNKIKVELDLYNYATKSNIKNVTGVDTPKFAKKIDLAGKNVISFGADMSSSVHADNKGKDILILGGGPTQGLDDTTLIAKAKYPINFTKSGKRFVLSLHYNGSNSFLFVNATKVY